MRIFRVTGKRYEHSVLEHGRADEPDTPPLLLLHGFLGDMLSWHYCVVPLSKYGKVYALDLPAHGRSGINWKGHSLDLIPWLEDAMNALNFNSCHVVAHSFGAWIALQTALKHPERFQSLSLVACAGLEKEFNFPVFRDALNITNDTSLRRYATALTGRKDDDAAKLVRNQIKNLADPSRQPVLMRMLENMITSASSCVMDPLDWPKLTMPVKFFWTKTDQIVPLPSAHALPPDAQLSLNDEGGHIPHILASGWLTHEISQFFATSQRAAA